MEPGTHRDIHELLTSYGYRESAVCNWNQSGGVKAKYYRYSKADRGNRHTVYEVYIHNDDSWQHSVMPMDEDRGGLPSVSGQGVDSLKAYLQKEHGDVLKGEGLMEACLGVAAVERALEKKRLELEVETYRERLKEMVEGRTGQLQAAPKAISQSKDETLAALGATLDFRDGDTARHARRVTRYCLELARVMGCSEEQMQQLTRGAYLHDIGKIGIPDAILLKPAKLTPDEAAVMQTHARIGYELVCHIPFLAEAAEIVLTHHERYDGSGYPQGLIGDEIPLGARIVAVAECFDNMVSDHPYKSAHTFEDALAELRRCSGTQFDPKVVMAFLDWLQIYDDAHKQQ